MFSCAISLKKFLPICLAAFISAASFAQKSKLVPLFNGKNLKGWTTFMEKRTLGQDPNQVISVKDGEIYVSGQEFGYIANNKSYKNYRLLLEFKWGSKRFPPRANAKRDAGICFHIAKDDNRIWPKSAEFQIQEGVVGDLWLIDSVTATVNGKQTKPKDYASVVKSKNAERPNGEWNSLELICKNGSFKFIVNGVTVNEGDNLSVTEGRILLQSEGAELYYRNIQIESYKD